MIERLRDEIESSALLSGIQVNEDIVVGMARIRAAEADVWVNVDPELEEGDAPDIAALLCGIERVLDVPPDRWHAIVDEVVDDIEDAVGDEPVSESTRLRDDLVLKSVVVFARCTLLRFAAPRQFPDSWIHVQLDEDLALEALSVDEREADARTVTFGTLDELLDHISKDDGTPAASAGSSRT